jgi:protein-tyrosine phosphatase
MKTEPFWIPGPWRGRLGIVPRPRGGDWLEDELRSWRRAGVDIVLSLLTPDETADLDLAEEAELARAHGLRFESFPIADRGIPSSKEAFSKLTAHLAEQLGLGKTAIVHCRQGIGRSALVAIGLLMLSGIDADAAVQRVTAARGCPVPETPEQRRWVLDFANSRTAPTTTVSEVSRPQSPIT